MFSSQKNQFNYYWVSLRDYPGNCPLPVHAVGVGSDGSLSWFCLLCTTYLMFALWVMALPLLILSFVHHVPHVCTARDGVPSLGSVLLCSTYLMFALWLMVLPLLVWFFCSLCVYASHPVLVFELLVSRGWSLWHPRGWSTCGAFHVDDAQTTPSEG